MTSSPDIGLVEEAPSNGHQDRLIYPRWTFFLWSHLKSRVYATQPETLEVLRQRIVEECRLITSDVLSKVRTKFENLLYYCLQVNGDHFEQYVK